MTDRIIKFLRRKDYEFLDELGRGSCGRTVLIRDDVIDEIFVCKKYEPYDDRMKKELFVNFIEEIKLLYLLNHRNVVRVFNYYIYPEKHVGYILMEYVQGNDIESYLVENPHDINDIFVQCISGFTHLEKSRVLHRDIRPMNILVSNTGVVKIIDFGFGKKAVNELDYEKSITLNWWCEPPIDFNEDQYSFKTEIYFVGKLFDKIIKENEVHDFFYSDILKKMCETLPQNRFESFPDLERDISGKKISEAEFNDDELEVYRTFSSNLTEVIASIAPDCKFYDDANIFQKRLEDCYRSVMLEKHLPSSASVIGCFLNGGFKYHPKRLFRVSELKEFVDIFKACSDDKKKIVIDNLHSKIDSIQRYTPPVVAGADFDDDIPF